MIIRIFEPIKITWSGNRGFGEYWFYEDNGKLMIDNECHDKEQIKKVLNELVDQSELLDKPFNKKEGK